MSDDVRADSVPLLAAEHRTGDPLPLLLGVTELVTPLDCTRERIELLIESMREQLHRYAAEHELRLTAEPRVELHLRATVYAERQP